MARTVPPVAAEELERVPEERLSCWADVPEDRVEVALPEERVVVPLERVPEVVVPEERVALLPELREDWVAEPLERLVLLPVLRVVVPVPRLRLSCCTEPEERLVLLPVLRVVVPVLRLRLSCWTAPLERLAEDPEDRDTEAPEERVVLWEERVVVPPEFPRERVWAAISGAVSMASAIAKVTAVVKILLIASQV